MARGKGKSIDQELAGMSGPPRHDEDDGVNMGDALNLTPDGIRAVRALVDETQRVKLLKEGLTDAVKGAAAKLGIKPAELSEMITLIIKEEEKGGVLEEKERKLEFTRNVLEAVAQHKPGQPDSAQ